MLLRSDLRFGLDAAAWAREVLHEPVDAVQAKLLNRTIHGQRDVLNCHRQWGKSTITSTRTAHRMKYRAPWFAVCIAPSGRQAAELLRKLESCARRMDMEPKGDGDNEISMVLKNGSRFVGLPDTEGRMRGFGAVHDLLIEEASRVKDLTYKAARPFVAAVDGGITLLSTPFGKRGFFYEAAEGGKTKPWAYTKVTAAESGRFSEGFLQEELEEGGAAWFGQEYLGVFTDTTESVFSSDALLDAMNSRIEALRL